MKHVRHHRGRVRPAPRRVAAAIAAATILAVSGACGLADDTLRDQEDQMTGVPLVETGPMPPEPPTVTANGTVIRPTLTHWIVDDEVVRSGPTNDAEAQSIVVPTVGYADPLTFFIAHPTIPPTLYFEVFDDLDDRNHPQGQGWRVDCTTGAEQCRMVPGADGVQVEVHLERAVERVVVLQVAYTAWPDVVERVPGSPALLTASWAVAVIP
ncbi:hypothetical protein OMK64_10505 [Cellulomonas fimi]|uniref:hypothetical protein n=1 Tax=Cellulomonas fimi TaxID=1708 RepID=UPI00234D41D3|nr:hypothetical protein [Cellulomonas fimi]MDC7121967.1 hypothetical protein [Cellulomonas fimi]